MKWYVLHVLTGCEVEVQRQLHEKGYEAFAVQETCVIRRGGQWHEEPRTVIPGYVFIRMSCTDRDYHVIKSVIGVIQILPKGKPYPLTTQDAAWIVWMGGGVLQPSKVDFNGNTPRIIDGPLVELEQYITKINRHRRRAHLSVPIHGYNNDIILSILPV